jgi:hypothetical protein
MPNHLFQVAQFGLGLASLGLIIVFPTILFAAATRFTGPLRIIIIAGTFAGTGGLVALFAIMALLLGMVTGR